MLVKYYVQKFLAFFLEYPVFRKKSTIGFSLLKTQKIRSEVSLLSKVYEPFKLNNTQIENYSYIASNSNISNTSIGKFCSIGPNFSSGLGIHPTDGISTSPMFYSNLKQTGFSFVENNSFIETKKTTIGNDVFIGANVIILDGISIGDGAIVGAGAVVVSDIPPYSIVVGVPAKIVKFRLDDNQIHDLLELKWWDLPYITLKELSQYSFNVPVFISKLKELSK